MKTNRFFAVLAALFFFCMAREAKAQLSCPYSIANNLGCNVTVDFTLFDASCSPCASGTGIVLMPGDVYDIPCSDFACAVCDVEVVLVIDNGVTVNTPINGSTGTVAVPGAPCSGGDNMTWSGSGVSINP